MRILKGSGFALASPTFVASDQETATNCDDPPTVTVVNAAGTTLTAPVVADAPGAGVYTATLTPAHAADLDVLTVTWTGAVSSVAQVYVQTVEVVGGFYASIVDLREALKGRTDDAEGNRFSVSLLMRIRDRYEDTCERVCGVAFVPRYHRETLFGNDLPTLHLSKARPRTLRSVSIDGTAQTVGNFAVDAVTERLIARSGSISSSRDFAANVAVGYEHGFDAPPADLREEALNAMVADILASTSDRPVNEISQEYNGQTIRFSTPNPKMGRPTGILNLDPILVRESMRFGVG